jgi:CrcB protein
MKTLALIGVGGALGAMARYGVVLGIGLLGGSGQLPWGTLAVNVAGSLLIGLLVGALSESAAFHGVARPLLIVGFLGAFTTFSAFSMETLNLLESGRVAHALIYVGISVVGCVAAAWCGVRLVV